MAGAPGLGPILDRILDSLIDTLPIVSVAVFATDADTRALELVAWRGFADPTRLAAAVQRPGHPIAAVMDDGVAAFDVRPVAAGGPALRGHLPLRPGRDGSDATVGVLAVAYEDPIGQEARKTLATVADRLALAIARDRAGQ